MVSMMRLIASQRNSWLLARTGAAIMPTGLHPVATDGHRAPPCGVGLASVYQKQTAFGVGTWPKPSRTGDSKGVPGKHRANSSPRVPAECQLPVHSTSAHRRAKSHGFDEALQ